MRYHLYALTRDDRNTTIAALRSVGADNLADAIALHGGHWGDGDDQFLYDFVKLCDTYELGSREAVCIIIRLLKFSDVHDADSDDDDSE